MRLARSCRSWGATLGLAVSGWLLRPFPARYGLPAMVMNAVAAQEGEVPCEPGF